MENEQGSETKSKSDPLRTTISYPRRIGEMAKKRMEARGFDNFSAYVADLIRRDHDREFEPASKRPTYDAIPEEIHKQFEAVKKEIQRLQERLPAKQRKGSRAEESKAEQ